MDVNDKQKLLIVRGSVAYLVLILAIVSVARLGLIPGAAEVGEAGGLFSHPYRLIMILSGFLLAAGLGTISGVAGVATRRSWVGLGLLALGGTTALLLSQIAPAILYPGDRYPVAFAWTVGGVPVAVVTWLAATTGGWAAERASSGKPA